MFTKDVRNQRILTAYVRAERSRVSADRAQAAIAKHQEAVKEVEWLKTAPVRDGKAGEDLPTEDELKAHLEEVRARRTRKQDDDPQA